MKKSLSILILVFTLASCMSEEKLHLNASRDLSIRTVGISKEKSFLGEEDAEMVAYIHRYGSVLTKSSYREIIESVEPICDEEGNTLMYVVNYAENEGFVIVSATKDYYPILVDVQEGQYDRTRMEGCGAGIFMDMYRSQIEKIMLVRKSRR